MAQRLTAHGRIPWWLMVSRPGSNPGTIVFFIQLTTYFLQINNFKYWYKKVFALEKQSFFHNLLMIPLHVNCFMTPVTEVYIHDSWKSKAKKNDNYISDLKDICMVYFLIMPISWRRIITVHVCGEWVKY